MSQYKMMLSCECSDGKTHYIPVAFASEKIYAMHEDTGFDTLLDQLNEHLPPGVCVDDCVEPENPVCDDTECKFLVSD